MKKLVYLAIAVVGLALAVSGCTDAGDPYIPGDGTITAAVTVEIMDMVGDWDNLHVNGALTGDSPVAMTQDGIMWSATITGVAAGTYGYDIVHDDGSKALVDVLTGLSVTVSDAGEVEGGVQEIDLEPMAGTGFNLLVINNNPAYDDIKIKGSYDGWATTERTGMSEDGMYVYKHVPAGLAEGGYEWGVIQDDGSEFGIWLLPGGNLTFDVDAQGVPTGTLTFTIEAPTPPVDVTFTVDMNAETVSGDGVHIAGSFGADGYVEWQPGAISMNDDGTDGDATAGDGIYSVTLTLTSETEYQFAFINGAAWEGQESVPSECGVDNGFGGFNRTLTTGADPETYATAYGGCPSN
jgi:hypothetical protein